MKKNIFTASILFFLTFFISNAQETIPLYSGEIPNSIPAKNEEYANADGVLFKTSDPTLTVYFPDKTKSNGTAIIICPGGGYGAVVMKFEGYTNAEKLRDLGYTCFILKYRVPDDSTMKDKSIGPIQDLQKAIKTVRENAKKWNISPNKIGLMGFSAGGHLASTAGTHFNKSFIENANGTSLRPDFMILVYPVISMKDALTHKGSQTALLGEKPTMEQINYFSNELQVTEQTPPTYLVQAGDDGLVKVENSIVFYEALKKNKVPAAMLIYPAGNHGFPFEPAKSNWFNSCVKWLTENQWDEKAPTKISYKNPINIEPLRDPTITFVNGTYYMTGTSQLDGSISKVGPGVKLFSSKNLTDWTFVKLLIKPEGWYKNRIWAPEIQQINNRFYLTLNAFAGNPISQGVCIAVADKIDGDYTILTPDKPLCEGNDGHLFQDDDGKIYLFTSDNGGVPLHDKIVYREISLNPLKILSEKKVAITPGTKSDWDGSPKEKVAIEGPYVIKQNNIYYLFYSSWGRGYEVGYATAKSMKGPWKKFKGNPIYGAQSKEISTRNLKVYTQSPDVPFTEVGHGNLFKTSDGQWWLSCHAIANGSDPKLTIDPVQFNEKGEVKINLTWTKQEVDLLKN